MNKQTKLKLLLMFMLAGTPCVAQTDSDTKKQEMRARNFAEFLLYWTEWEAFFDVGHFDKKRAEHREYDDSIQQIPELVRDSAYYANEITKGASLINQRYPLNTQPDMPYFMYEIEYSYDGKNPDKTSAEYILGENLERYEQTLKKLKLARYTVKVNQK